MSGEHIQHVSDIEEYRTLLQSGACVVKFTAAWCGPCRHIAPTFKKLARDYSSKITAIEVDIDANGSDEISDLENIQAVPYVLFYRGGRIAAEHVGGDAKAFEDAFLKFVRDEAAELESAIDELENTVTDIQNIIEAKIAAAAVTEAPAQVAVTQTETAVEVVASAPVAQTETAVEAPAPVEVAQTETAVETAHADSDSDSDLEDIIGDDEDDAVDNTVLTIAAPTLDMSKLAQDHDEESLSYEDSLTDEDVDVAPGDEAGTDMLDTEIAAHVVNMTT